ncbi:MAG: CopD family protein [Steroidobacteraceae bacterium]
MLPDVLSAALRGLSFVAMAQAAGALLFLLLFGSTLVESLQPVRRTARVAVIWALMLVPAQFLLEAARMSGRLAGLVDLDLQAFALSTPMGRVMAVRILGLAIVAMALQVRGRLKMMAAVAGVLLVSASFAMVGHTTMDPLRWLVGPAIVLHVLIVAFWFGSLRPLIQVVKGESGQVPGNVVARFSRLAAITVPLAFLAGLLIAFRLLPDWHAISSPYGLALLGKVLAFGVLMGLAALNKWRLGPALSTGGATAASNFCSAVAIEWLIIVVVLLGTAALTTFLSPAG